VLGTGRKHKYSTVRRTFYQNIRDANKAETYPELLLEGLEALKHGLPLIFRLQGRRRRRLIIRLQGRRRRRRLIAVV